jgi:hypothetical protein
LSPPKHRALLLQKSGDQIIIGSWRITNYLSLIWQLGGGGGWERGEPGRKEKQGGGGRSMRNIGSEDKVKLAIGVRVSAAAIAREGIDGEWGASSSPLRQMMPLARGNPDSLSSFVPEKSTQHSFHIRTGEAGRGTHRWINIIEFLVNKLRSSHESFVHTLRTLR